MFVHFLQIIPNFLYVILLVGCFLTEIRQIWGHFHFLDDIFLKFFLRQSLDIGSLVFSLLG